MAPALESLTSIWETQIEFPAPGIRLAQQLLLEAFGVCLSLLFSLSAFQINKLKKKTKKQINKLKITSRHIHTQFSGG